MTDLAPASRSCRRCRERCHTWQLHRSPDTPRRLGQAFSPRTIRNPVVRQNSSGLSIISALLVAARSTPELRVITMFTPRRNSCFDVLLHFHHRQSISDKQPKLRTWLESYTVTADSFYPALFACFLCLLAVHSHILRYIRADLTAVFTVATV